MTVQAQGFLEYTTLTQKRRPERGSVSACAQHSAGDTGSERRELLTEVTLVLFTVCRKSMMWCHSHVRHLSVWFAQSKQEHTLNLMLYLSMKDVSFELLDHGLILLQIKSLGSCLLGRTGQSSKKSMDFIPVCLELFLTAGSQDLVVRRCHLGSRDVFQNPGMLPGMQSSICAPA